MKIRVLSDLHLEFRDWRAPPGDADVVVLAGDIHVGLQGLDWARREFPLTPVVYVPGNHEFYGKNLQPLREELLSAGRRLGVDVLDERALVIGGVRFLGATLWTDFALHGSDVAALRRAMQAARTGMNDFRRIHFDGHRLFTPEDAREIHLRQLAWLRSTLAAEFPGPTVVVTHHLPHRRSIHRMYEGTPLSPSFASDLGGLMSESVSLWVHGHAHESSDYLVNGTRVVCNPRGYAGIELNPDFDSSLTVEVQDRRGLRETLPASPEHSNLETG